MKTAAVIFTFMISCSAYAQPTFCSNAITIQSGQTVTGTTAGGLNKVNQYSGCGPNYLVWKGPEKVYAFTIADTSDVKIVLTTGTYINLIAFLFKACDSSACINSSYASNNIVRNDAPPGNYYIVVDGLDTTGAAFDLSLQVSFNVLDCSSAIPLKCGQVVKDSTRGDSHAGHYGCNGYGVELMAGERIYAVTNANAGNIFAEFHSGNSELFILNTCRPLSCVASDTYQAVYRNAPAGTHYFVVDGRSPASDSFTLRVFCPSVSLDCGSAIPLQPINFNDIIDGTTAGGNANADTYSCTPGDSYRGPEKIYKITTRVAGDIVAKLSSQEREQSFNVMILSDCSAASCLASAGFVWLSSSDAVYKNAPPGTYYIVVDTYGSGGKYSLSLQAEAKDQYIKVVNTLFTNQIYLQYNIPLSLNPQYLTIRLFSPLGQKVYENHKQVPDGFHNFSIRDLQKLTKGYYFLQLSNGNSVYVYKVLKQG